MDAHARKVASVPAKTSPWPPHRRGDPPSFTAHHATTCSLSFASTSPVTEHAPRSTLPLDRIATPERASLSRRVADARAARRRASESSSEDFGSALSSSFASCSPRTARASLVSSAALGVRTASGLPRTTRGSRLTRNRPSASTTVGIFIRRANAKISRANASDVASRPSPGPITTASMFRNHRSVFRTPSSNIARSFEGNASAPWSS
mmetsp:Transcript_1894/g.7881  ORF Transcript_1894/g.7881 Transcript_1894/m.7881 type:complete len:208 (+) Transcript_1894:619-1242(+)